MSFIIATGCGQLSNAPVFADFFKRCLDSLATTTFGWIRSLMSSEGEGRKTPYTVVSGGED